MSEARYKKLLVWQKADELAFQVYAATKNFPKEETYGITSQLRRSTLSVPLNIVEGCARSGKKEFKQFLNIALGSYAECEYLMLFCSRLGYFSQEDFNRLENLRQGVGRLLWSFYKTVSC